MKNFLLFLLLLVFLQSAAQVPQQINYQGVARNSVGSVIANQNISLRLSVRQGTTTGPVVYQETRNLKTNSFGLFVIAIGSTGATNVSGVFNSINWGSGAKFLQVEIDPRGSSGFIDMGTSQLLSVPYAIHAGSASPAGTAGGDLTGDYPSPQLKDNSVNQSKISDGAVSAAKLAPGVIPTSLPPTGFAGGELQGNYPNPSVKAGAITTNKLADGAVTSIKLADNAVITSKILDGSITASKLAP